jgi:hypothetical protein
MIWLGQRPISLPLGDMSDALGVRLIETSLFRKRAQKIYKDNLPGLNDSRYADDETVRSISLVDTSFGRQN